MDYEKKIDIPFGANDSELKGWEYTIPEGMEAEIKDGKVVVRQKENEDERIRKQLINEVKEQIENIPAPDCCDSDDLQRLTILQSWLAYLERQKEQKPNCNQKCILTDEQLIATDFWREYLRESIIPGNKPTKQDIDFLLPTARKYFSLIMKETCIICKEHSRGYQEGLKAGRRDHWKPTYNQMAAIEECLRFYTESTDTYQYLKSLLNNLKDL